MGRDYDRGAQYLGLILLVGLILTMVCLLVTDLVKTKDYVSVDAALERVSTEYGKGTKSNMMQFKYANYSFEYQGKEWQASRPTFFLDNDDVGKIKTIRFNPNDPTILENTAFRFAEIVLLIFSIFSVVAVRRSM